MKMKKEKVSELFEDIKNKVRAAHDEVLLRTDKWVERMAFYRGFHYSIVGADFVFDEEDATGELSEVHNYIPSFVKASVAARIRNFPNVQVPASNGTHEAMAKARATEQLLKSFVDDEVLSGEELVRALTLSSVLGGSWLKIWWDPEAGRYTKEDLAVEEDVDFDEDGNVVYTEKPITDPFGDPIVSFSREGQITTTAVDPFDGWPDPTASAFKEMRYWVHRKMLPVDTLRRKYPKDIHGKDIKWSPGHLDEVYQLKKNVTNDDLDSSIVKDDENGLAPLVEFWGAPNDDYPNGILCVYSGDDIVYLGSCPYRPGRLPCVFIPGDNIIPRGLYSDGTVEHLITLQRTLNRSVTKQREWLDKILNPMLLVPYGSGVNAKTIGEIPGQILEYNPGLRPDWMQVPPIAPSLFSVQNTIFQEMKIISGYSDITRGDMPSGGATGRAIAFLQENEENIRSADIKLFKGAVTEALKQCLFLSKQYYQDGRLIKHLGDESWQLFEFQSADFDWYVDLAPEMFSGAPNSRALRWAETLEAFQLGLFDDEAPGAKEVRRMLQMDHGARSTVDPNVAHRNLAEMENSQLLAMAQGADVSMNQVREFHDDEVHLEVHNQLRNSPRYLELDPYVRQVLDEHCEVHEENLQAKMGAFSDAQAMLGPQPGQAPAPQPPGMSPRDGGAPTQEPSAQQMNFQQANTPIDEG